MTTEIRVPTLGESVTEATIAKWMKAEGDAVAADEPLVELETDKVSVEVPAPAAGVLASIAAREGDTVEVNALLGAIEAAGAAAKKPAAKKAEPAKAETKKAEPKKTAPASAAGGEDIEVTVPASGESVTEADIGEWLKKIGDAVEADEPLVSLETDKAAMDVPSPAAGVLKEIRAQVGDTVSVGAVIAVISSGGAPAKVNGSAASAAAAPAPAVKSAASEALSPAPRRVVAERGLDPASIEGTGKDGRVTKGDALKAEAKPAQAKAPAAMLTTFNDVDMTAVMELRNQYKDLFDKKHGIKLGFMSFFVKACVHALKEVPDVNAEIDGTDIIYKNHYDIGVAVGTEKGLVVPIVRDADLKSMAEIELEIAELGRRARDGALKIEEMQGGTFTISNGGVYGSLLSTPILNQPQSGILGMHRIEERPVARDGQVVVRPMMYLAMSSDHRIVDGKGAVTFLVRVKENLEDPQRLLLDL